MARRFTSAIGRYRVVTGPDEDRFGRNLRKAPQPAEGKAARRPPGNR
jgi:hypothetical protein